MEGEECLSCCQLILRECPVVASVTSPWSLCRRGVQASVQLQCPRSLPISLPKTAYRCLSKVSVRCHLHYRKIPDIAIVANYRIW